MANKRILELDGLRAFAVLAVIVYHMVYFSEALPKISRWIYKPIEYLGHGGVYVFFVISGYIITSLLVNENTVRGQVSLKSFYIRRFFRIVPPFAVYLFTLFLLCQTGYLSLIPINLLLSSLFLGNFGFVGDPTSPDAWFVAHTWSLSIEEQYYLLLPPIMSVFRFRLRSISILIISLFSLAACSYKLSYELSEYVHPSFNNMSYLFQFRYILIGVIFAIHKDIIHTILKEKSILFPISCLSFVFLLSVSSYFFPPPLPLQLSLNAFEPMLYGVFVMWFVHNPEKCTVLRWSSVQRIGSYSYSIYLWQQLFTGRYNWYNGYNIAKFPIAIMGISACAYISFKFIEQPSIRFGRELTKKWQ